MLPPPPSWRFDTVIDMHIHGHGMTVSKLSFIFSKIPAAIMLNATYELWQAHHILFFFRCFDAIICCWWLQRSWGPVQPLASFFCLWIFHLIPWWHTHEKFDAQRKFGHTKIPVSTMTSNMHAWMQRGQPKQRGRCRMAKMANPAAASLDSGELFLIPPSFQVFTFFIDPPICYLHCRT